MGQSKTLTAKETAFAQAFVETGNQSEAYRRVYKSDTMKPTTINRKAKEVADREHVVAYIAELQGEHRQRHDVTVDYVIGVIVETIDRSRQVEPVLDKRGEQVYIEDASGKLVPAFKFDASNVLRGAELLGKHLGMFKDTVNHVSDDGSMTPVFNVVGVSPDGKRSTSGGSSE